MHIPKHLKLEDANYRHSAENNSFCTFTIIHLVPFIYPFQVCLPFLPNLINVMFKHQLICIFILTNHRLEQGSVTTVSTRKLRVWCKIRTRPIIKPNLFSPEICMDVEKMRNIQKRFPKKPSLCLLVRGQLLCRLKSISVHNVTENNIFQRLLTTTAYAFLNVCRYE